MWMEDFYLSDLNKLVFERFLLKTKYLNNGIPIPRLRKVFVKKGGGGWNRSSTHVVCISWPETVIFRSLPCVDRNMRLRYVLFKSFSVRVTARVGRNDLIFQGRWVSRKVLAWRKVLGTFQEFIGSEIYMALLWQKSLPVKL